MVDTQVDWMGAIRARHSVRSYTARPIEKEKVAALQAQIDRCNREGGLHIQLVTEEPRAFDSIMAHYGKFSGVRNYLALIGPKGESLEEKLGYYGEQLVLYAQALGLNTCWVALTFSKGKVPAAIDKGEKLVCVITLGYGEGQGTAHKSKAVGAVSETTGDAPEWFRRGMEAALLAPTAVNQQKYLIELKGDRLSARATGGFYAKVDLGIVKYHFEVGAGIGHDRWTTSE